MGVREEMVSNSSMSRGMSNAWAMASRWRTALVEPPVAATEAMALSIEARVTKVRGRTSRRTRSMTSSPVRRAASSFLGSTAGISLSPAGERPMNSMTMLMVLAVYWPPQAPAPGQATDSIAYSSLAGTLPAPKPPIASYTDTMSWSWPWYWPGRMVPLYRVTVGMSSRPAAMAAPGPVLSHPKRHTRPSNRWPRATSSMESAMTSRLTRDAFMPSVPMVTPSLTEMVLNSMGVPPAARMPSLTAAARSRWLRLQGIVSIHSDATPMSGLARSSSVKPTALSIARAPARSGPSVSAAECRFAGSEGRS